MRLNFGSNRKKMAGFVNVDALELPEVDVVHDLNKTPYPFADNSAEQIVMIEFLEHLPFRSTGQCLRECYRIIAPGGEIYIQVPDIGKMCEMYVRHQICDCVPHKALEYKATPNCPECSGKAKINTNRWRFAFAGAQRHPFDAHLNHFTREILEKELLKAGFQQVTQSENIYKLVLKAKKI